MGGRSKKPAKTKAKAKPRNPQRLRPRQNVASSEQMKKRKATYLGVGVSTSGVLRSDGAAEGGSVLVSTISASSIWGGGLCDCRVERARSSYSLKRAGGKAPPFSLAPGR